MSLIEFKLISKPTPVAVCIEIYTETDSHAHKLPFPIIDCINILFVEKKQTAIIK